MVANISAVAFSVLPIFFVFLSSDSTLPSLSSLSSSSSSPTVSYSTHSVTERAKIFRSSPASDYLLKIAASAENGGRRTTLSGVQSCCFFDRARSPAAAQRITSIMGRWILSPSMAKAISVLIETTEGQSIFPARENITTGSLRDLFPTVVCQDVSWTFSGMAILVSMEILGKSSQTVLYFWAAGSLARMMTSCYIFHSDDDEV